MAWRSSGTNNDEMVDNLKRFNVITSPVIERGFRNVDRRFFVPNGREAIAHADQPLKDGNVHISAPHIYGTALEALELAENNPLAFLNVGSGTGYVSCIIASILGPQSTSYGVEIQQDVVDHSEKAIAKWQAAYTGEVPYMHVVRGNALHISKDDGEGLLGFDRIYIGASVEQRDLSSLTCLLKAGGILVGPVGDELVKIVRIKKTESEAVNDFSQQVLSGVRFAPLLPMPRLETVLPSRVWSPSIHQTYPDSFRKASKAILMCSNSNAVQPPVPVVRAPDSTVVNLSAMLPQALWLEILSYTHRTWFEPPQSQEVFLRQRLTEEAENSRKAHAARMEAEARLHIAERERDVYRLLARRWQSRLEVLLQEQRNNGSGNVMVNGDDDDEVFRLDRRESAVIFGLGAMLRGFDSDDDDSDDEDEVSARESMVDDNQEEESLEEESDDDGNYEFASDDEEVPGMDESAVSALDSDSSPSTSPSTSRNLIHRAAQRNALARRRL